MDIRPIRGLEAAVHDAEVALTATYANEPLIHGEWLHRGHYITGVGADDATKCELDASALWRAHVFVDERCTALATGDVRRAIQDGAYTPDELTGELGHVLEGAVHGRTTPEDITTATMSDTACKTLSRQRYTCTGSASSPPITHDPRPRWLRRWAW